MEGGKVRECKSNNSILKKMCCAPLNNIIPTTILTTRETDLNERLNNKRGERESHRKKERTTERERERGARRAVNFGSFTAVGTL